MEKCIAAVLRQQQRPRRRGLGGLAPRLGAGLGSLPGDPFTVAVRAFFLLGELAGSAPVRWLGTQSRSVHPCQLRTSCTKLLH